MTKTLHAPKHKGASKELARQQGIPSIEDQELAAEGVDVSNFLVDVSGRHGLKVNFAEAITEGHVERSIEGASVISITISDSTKEILKSGIFGTKDNKTLPVLDVRVEGMWFRLASFQKHGEELTLEFEDRIVYFFKTKKHPMSASRAHTTRAEFIGRMVRSIKHQRIRYFCPELHVKQPIEGIKPKKPTERERRAEKAGGLLSTTDLTVKGQKANKNQLEIMEEVLDTGVSMGADKKVLVSSIMCIIQESDVHNDKGTNGVDVGPFNQNIHDGWPASGNVPKDAEAYFKAAMANDKSNPQYTLAELVQSVQKSAFPTAYAQWRKEAEKILEEYGEKGIAAKHSHVFIKEYDFHVGPPDGPEGENYWEASERLAKEVNWRRFVVGNTFYFVQDKDLIKSKPIMEFSEDTEAIEEIDGIIDAHIPVSECTVKCRATRWWAPPGSVVKIKDTGPFSGRWLVFSVWRDLFSVECEVKLHQPESAKPEKAPETESVPTSGSGEALVLGAHVSGGTARERIVEAAKWGLAHKSLFTYQEIRPMPKSLFLKSIVTDCSGFATLCYKAADVTDPNGSKYNGQGYTGTLQAHGSKTNTPNPGDLVFYKAGQGAGGAAGHVGVYIGNGMVIDFGHQGAPDEHAINAETVVEVRTYSLETDPGLTPKPSKHGEAPTPISQQGPTPAGSITTPIPKEALGEGLG
jgi:hypothetical protein